MSEIDFIALKKPFGKSDVKYRPVGGGNKVPYITARHVMNRLDTVCGPANWRDEYAPSLTGEGIQCTLYIRVDGEWIGKTDVGTESDQEEDKGAYSDAIKRAGVKWGIARELYGDGVADLGGPKAPPTSKTATPAHISIPSGDVVADGDYEPDRGNPFSHDEWGVLWPWLVKDGLADNKNHAINILRQLGAEALNDFDPKNPWRSFNPSDVMVGEVIDWFTRHAAQKE